MNELCVEVKNLSKCFFIPCSQETSLKVLKRIILRQPMKKEFWALRDITFSVKKGEKLAVVGKNGSGKTTLLRILGGIYNETSGYVRTSCDANILLAFWVGFNGELSVIENAYLFGAIHGISRRFLKDKMDEILNAAELFDLRYAYLKEISSGQRQRLALSVFFQNTENFLIFDESLTCVDKYFSQVCEKYFQSLLESDKTVIVCSHDTSFLRKHCNTAIWMDEGRIRMIGSAEEVITKYEVL